ncbi:AraC family transcriptional regulator [Diplocloster hominis]|uniref:AraC family transcriptional regulator n=1 Tax=Diplocloster hominis TaxID=3079010 RepID=UPI0031BA97D4
MAYFEERSDLLINGIKCSAGIRKDYNYSAHWHRECEITCVVNGQIDLWINSYLYHLQPGDIVFCPGGYIHYGHSISEKSTMLIMLFHPDLIEPLYKSDELRTMYIDAGMRLNSKENQNAVNEIESCIFLILNELIGKKAEYIGVIQGKVLVMTSLLKRLFPVAVRKEGSELPYTSLVMMQKALSYIDSRFRDDISLEEVAGRLAVSSCYLSRMFPRITGQTFKDYLAQKRIEYAVNLIHNTDMTILDIALDSGFNSIRTFNRCFKAVTGEIPTAERRHGKKERN